MCKGAQHTVCQYGVGLYAKLDEGWHSPESKLRGEAQMIAVTPSLDTDARCRKASEESV